MCSRCDFPPEIRRGSHPALVGEPENPHSRSGGLVASGGLSFLSSITVTGSIPLRVEVPGIPAPPGFDPRLTLRAVPGQSEHRWGVNGGAGLRFGGRVALIGEMRVFYVRDYDLRFEAVDGAEILDELVSHLSVTRFTPVFINAQAGVTFKF